MVDPTLPSAWNTWVVAYLAWNNSGPNGAAFVDTSTKSLAQYTQWANDPYFGLVLTLVDGLFPIPARLAATSAGG